MTGYDANLAWHRTRASVRGSSPSRSLENPFDLEPEADSLREQYGRTSFGQSCLLARRSWNQVFMSLQLTCLTRYLTPLPGTATARRLSARLGDYARVLLPEFDRDFSALIDDLDRQGRLDTTLVVAAGEFGRPLAECGRRS